jgi:hypothetical protein
VPLDEAYLELVAVVDEAEAAESAFGRWVAGAQPPFARPLGGPSAPTDSTTSRVGSSSPSPPAHGTSRAAGSSAGDSPASSRRPPSHRSRSSSSGVEGRHFRAVLRQPIGPERRKSEVRLAGDADRIAAWLGPHRLPVSVRPGAPALTSIVLSGTAGEIVLAEI